MTREKFDEMLLSIENNNNEERPVYTLGYATKENYGIELGNTVFISVGTKKFNTRTEILISEAIKNLTDIENSKNFMFFLNSEEGVKFIDENEKSIRIAFGNMVLRNASVPMSICM